MRLFILFIVLFIVGIPTEGYSMKVLMVGNSFSICVCNNLPNIVGEAQGCDLELVSAYIGGCSLRRHWDNIQETEANPEKKQYQVSRRVSGAVDFDPDETGSINELISRSDWDVITIQQASHESWDYSNYQPFADNLIEYIRKHSPKSEIMIQQTWAYRADDPRLMPGGAWGFDQAGMHARVVEAYDKLAKHTGFRVIPTGKAVALYRERTPGKFVPNSEEVKNACRWPDLPKQASDVAGNFGWSKNRETGELQLGCDCIHLNQRGEYLQACVWFGVLFGRDPMEITYVPNSVGNSDAVFLRKCARDAISAK